MSAPVELDVSARFASSTERVWHYVSREGVSRLVDGGFFRAVEFFERRPLPGAIRRCFLDDAGGFIDEQLVEWIPQAHRYVYRLADTGPLPPQD